MLHFLKRRKKKVVILGSCVSRDTMELIPSQNYELILYTARTKIVSQLSPSYAIQENEICLSSAFQKKIVLNDLNKEQFQRIEASKPDFCIIDFIDERFSLIEYADSFLTKSNELVNSGWLKDKDYKELQYTYCEGVWKIGGGYLQKLDDYLYEYLKRILKHFKQYKIILHKAYLLDTYIDCQGEKQYFESYIVRNNDKINKMLRFMYDYIEKSIRNIKVIDISDKYFACENHKWGLAPMHYQEEYYKEAAEMLIKYMRL